MQYGLTKFKNGIVADFVTAKKTTKVLFIMDGLPSGSGKYELSEAFAKKGFFVIHPRYRGTWESEGRFFSESPALDVLDTIPLLTKGFKDYWSGKKFKVNPKSVFVIGASFGGMTALLCALDPRVKKAIAFSPVVSWTAQTKQEPLSWLYRLLREIYAPVYRFSDKDWEKARTRAGFNPIMVADKIDSKKVLVVYSKDDPSIPLASMKRFVERNGCKNLLLARGGHLSASLYYKNKRIHKMVNNFLKK